MPPRRPHPAAVLGALFVVATGLALAAGARAPGHRGGTYLAVHATLTLLALGAWWALRRRPDERALAWVVGCGLVARALLVPSPAFTTTDVARYLWDGAVALAGRDPYALAPGAPALASLRAAFPPPSDHLDVATCYPPLALALFALAAAAGGALAFFVWKALTAAASCAAVVLLWRHLRGSARAPDAVLLALSPIFVLEAGVGAHLDAFTALAVLAAAVRAEQGRWDEAALAAGCAGALKLMPGLVVVPLLVRAPGRVRFALLAALPAVVTTGLALALGMTPPGSLSTVARHWSFAAPVWSLLYHYHPYDDDTIRPALAAGGLALILAASLLPRTAAKNARDAFGVGLAASPVLYPWYTTPLAALTALRPAAWSLALMAAAPFSYEVLDAYQATGRWAPATWPVVLTAAATLAGLAVDAGVLAWRRWRARG